MNQDTMKIVNCWQDIQGRQQNHYVTINYSKLEAIVESRATSEFSLPQWRIQGLYPQHDWTFAVNQLVSNCFNFCFNVFEIPGGKYQVLNPYDPPRPYLGAMAMQRKIYAYFGEKIIQAQDLSTLVKSISATKTFFADLTPIPYPELRYECGRNFVKNLESCYGGNPMNLLESTVRQNGKVCAFRAFNDGEGLVDLLIHKFPETYGEDIQQLEGHTLRFNKRAQLVALLLHGRASRPDSSLPSFSDIDEIGPIADYEVPRGLRSLGILIYGPKLASFVDNWKPIEKNSRMEVEIRAATVTACFFMLAFVNAALRGCNLLPIHIGHLDYWLWQMGRQASGFPHLVRTSAY